MTTGLKSILVVTDAWHPQVNGVVRSIEKIGEELTERGIRVDYITPSEFRTVPMPGYSEIGLSMTHRWSVVSRIEALNPDAIHIATEGPLGWLARNHCVRARLPFSTAYHTQFPEYMRARAPLPLNWGYAIMRRFHKPARACLVGTPFLKAQLLKRGFANVELWTKGVDTVQFHPSKRAPLDNPGPIFLYVGRVAVEKNIEAFLKLDLPGTKIVVGDGPSCKQLKAQCPEVVFVGAKHGDELARYFAAADAFVFPSKTDTFGLVLLEALASGTPVAAYPVTGPIDVIGAAPVGVLDNDLRAAALKALTIPRESCRSYAELFSWAASADQFLSHQTMIVR
jgi:glycosyltransferase involved in cell wall biosynthesis